MKTPIPHSGMHRTAITTIAAAILATAAVGACLTAQAGDQPDPPRVIRIYESAGVPAAPMPAAVKHISASGKTTAREAYYLCMGSPGPEIEYAQPLWSTVRQHCLRETHYQITPQDKGYW